MAAAAPLPQSQGWEDFTVYELDFAALAPAGVANSSIEIQADSSFKWVKSAFSANIAVAAFLSGTRPIPNISIQVVDGGTGRQLFSSAVPVPSIFGSGELPFILPVSRIFKARSSIQVTVANYDAAVTYNLRLSFIGTKIFQAG